MPTTVEKMYGRYDSSFKDLVEQLDCYINFEQIIKEFVNTLPNDLLNNAIYNSMFMFSNEFHCDFTLAYSIPNVKSITKWLQENLENYYEYDSTDKSRLRCSGRQYFNEREFSIKVEICFDTNYSGSTCILVPIETEQKTVILTYDRVCPDSHPDLFKKDADGKLIYVGDNLFPALK